MKKILYALKTTKKYKSRRDSQLNTWLSNIEDFIYYSDHEDLHNNIILASHDDSYYGLLEKSLYFYNNLGNIFVNDSEKSILDTYKWIFVGDDDTFVNIKNLEKFLDTCDEEFAYGCLYSPETHPKNPIWNNSAYKWKPGETYLSGGAGILVSTKSLKKVDKFISFGVNLTPEDCNIGLNFHRNNIKLVNCPLFFDTHPENYGQSYTEVVKNITYHHISEDKMYKLYEYLK